MIYFEVSQKNRFSVSVGSLPACDPIPHDELERFIRIQESYIRTGIKPEFQQAVCAHSSEIIINFLISSK